MGRTSQQRRANNKRLASQRQRMAHSAFTAQHERAADDAISTEQLVVAAAHYAANGALSRRAFADVVEQLVQREGRGVRPTPFEVLSAQLGQAVAALYERGWQPADVVHAVKRQLQQRNGRLALAAIAAQARQSGAPERAPEPWLAQLADLRVFEPGRGTVIGGHDHAVKTWANTERLHVDDALAGAAETLALLLRAPRQPALIEPPSAWPASNRGLRHATPAATGEVDPKALKLIRALLAKAEATNFAAEADTFTTKAQDLMTRYSIDAAVVAAQQHVGSSATPGVQARRVHIEHPYADEKAELLAVIADVNGARAVWSPSIGVATVMGFPVDLQLTDLLFTSLLFQATRASAAATAEQRELRTASFRRAFLVAFAARIGERLRVTRHDAAEGAQHEYGAALVPILADREAAVTAAYEQMFPDTTVGRARQINARGWYAGRAAADLARLGAGPAISGT